MDYSKLFETLYLWWYAFVTFMYMNFYAFIGIGVFGWFMLTYIWVKLARSAKKGTRKDVFTWYLNSVIVWLIFLGYLFWCMLTYK